MVWPNASDNKKANFNLMDLPGHLLNVEFADTNIDYMLNLDINNELACCRLTGIWASLGRATHNVETIEKMIEAGMDVAVINLNFGSTEEHLSIIEMARDAATNYSKKMGAKYPLAIGIMLSGKKIRTGKVSPIYGDCIQFKEDVTVRITTDDTFKDRCSAQTIFVDYEGFATQLKKGDEILIDNEELMLRVEVVSFTTVTCKVERGGSLGSYKDVFVPQRCSDMPNFSQKDEENIKMAVKNKLDFIVLSFMNNVKAVTECRNLIGAKANKRVKIVVNIQTLEGYRNYDDFLKEADCIMISRQQLGCEVGFYKLIIVQKDMIARANIANVPVIVGSHILNSMKFYLTPHKSDEIDAGNCVLDGADGFFISAETAVGRQPVETVTNLARICKESELCMWTKNVYNDLVKKTFKPCDPPTAVAIGAVLAAQRSLASMIVVSTVTGKAAQLVAKFRPRCPVVAVINRMYHAKYLQMFRGIIPLLYEDPIRCRDWQIRLYSHQDYAVAWAIEQGFVNKGDPIVVVFGRHSGSGNTNAFRVVYANLMESKLKIE